MAELCSEGAGVQLSCALFQIPLLWTAQHLG